MHDATSRKAAWLATTVVGMCGVPILFELSVRLAHDPSRAAGAIVLVLLFAIAAVGAALVWTHQSRTGAWLILWAMFAALILQTFHRLAILYAPPPVRLAPPWDTGLVLATVFSSGLNAIACAIAAYLLTGPLAARHAPK